MKIKKILLSRLFIAILAMIAGATKIYAMTINVNKVGANKSISLEVEPNETIDSVKTKIQEKEGLPPDRQYLVFLNRCLEEGKTLSDYNIQEHMSIMLYEIDNSEKVYTFNSIQPKNIDEFYGICDDQNILSGLMINEQDFNSDFTKCKATDSNLGIIYSNVNFVYNYDKNVKKEIDEIFKKIPSGKNNFLIKDLELVNYWVNKGQINYYSSELMSYLGYKNFEITFGAGDDSYVTTKMFGVANFKYDGTIYYINPQMEIGGEHVIYVPTNTENLMKAVQERIDNYVGKGKAIVSDCGTTTDWKNSIDPNDYSWLEADGLLGTLDKTADNHVYKLTVGTEEHYFVIGKDSTKMYEPKYKTSDILTNISISTNSGALSLDTTIKAKKITSGDEYNRILKILNVTDNEMFDLKLFSSGLNKNITKLDDGTFEVRIPVTEKLKGKKLVAYYVYGNNKTEYPVTIDGNYAIFNTDHFSIYTLAVAPKSTYTITVNGENITVTPQNVIKVLEGSSKEIEIKANDGYKLTSVKVDGVENMPLTNGKITIENISKNITIDVSTEKIAGSVDIEETTNTIYKGENSPKTGDNVFTYITMFIIAFIGIIISTLKIKNKK